MNPLNKEKGNEYGKPVWTCARHLQMIFLAILTQVHNNINLVKKKKEKLSFIPNNFMTASDIIPNLNNY